MCAAEPLSTAFLPRIAEWKTTLQDGNREPVAEKKQTRQANPKNNPRRCTHV
jgi:hypothetical protein